MPTVNIPGIGPLEKKYVYIGGAAVAGFVGYAYWRHRQSAAVDATATDDTATDTSALTDANAAASDSSAYGDIGDYSGYAYGGAPIYQSPLYNYPSTATGAAPTSDPEWYQAASEWLTNTGVEPQVAGSALSLYMANLCMTSAQADYVRQAIGALGEPPQTHHTIQLCTTSGGTGSTGTPPPAPTGLKVQSTDRTGITLTWNTVSGAQRYLIHIGGGPQKYNHSVTDTAPPYRFGALSHNSTYTFNVRAVVNGVDSPASSTISGKTKK